MSSIAVQHYLLGGPRAVGRAFLPLDDGDANIQDSNDKILRKMNSISDVPMDIAPVMPFNPNVIPPFQYVSTPVNDVPVNTTLPVNMVTPINYSAVPPQYVAPSSDILPPVLTIDQNTLTTPQQAQVPTATYTPVNPIAPFGTGNTGPAIMTPAIPATVPDSAAGSQSLPVVQSASQAGMITLFGYTASPVTWGIISIVTVWALSSVLGGSPKKR